VVVETGVAGSVFYYGLFLLFFTYLIVFDFAIILLGVAAIFCPIFFAMLMPA